MERQKPRAGQPIDGFNRDKYRPHQYIDGFYRSESQPAKTNSSPNSAALPSLRPRPIPYAKSYQVNGPKIQSQSLESVISNAPNRRHDSNQVLTPQPAATLLPQLSPTTIENVVNQDNLAVEQDPDKTSRSNKRFRLKYKPKKIAFLSSAALLLLVLGVGGWYAASLLNNVNKVFHGNVFSDAHALIGGTKLKESNGRINILLAGQQGVGSDEGPITDSIMVISVNPKTKKGFILSIPRDLWVYIPTMGHQKINAANDVASFSKPGYPSGGMGQLQQIVQKDLGIPIDYEALIDYTAFKDAVNAVGGITININSPDPRGLYDPYAHIKLPNGQVTLSGTQALNLARARGDGYGSYGFPNNDFSRTMYQRKMLKGLFAKATSIGVLTNPVKVTNLFSAFGSNVQTNLTLGDILSLVNVSSGINISNLRSVTYSFGGTNPLLMNYTDPVSGQEALIPSKGLDNFSQLQAFYRQLSSSNPIVQEVPTVTLLNASKVYGLAAREQKVLESQGFNVSIGNASTEYPNSMIIDSTNGKKPAAAKQLESDIIGSVVTASNTSSEAQQANNYSSNFVVVMGQNWDNTTQTSKLVQ